MKRRIALLFHANQEAWTLRTYGLAGLEEVWRAQGHEVLHLFGTDQRPEADLVFVHVDLSVVPEEYLAFAATNPVAVNGRVKDIRKTAFSAHLLGPGDPWTGPVIVKSDRNYGGLPEAKLGFPRLDPPLASPAFMSPLDYRIFDRLSEVPGECFTSPDYVVQKFLPEMEDGLFHVRSYQFLGDRSGCVRTASDHPIVKSETAVARMPAKPHPDVVALRERLGFDYGKFDYVEHDGQAFVLDLNKTPGQGLSAGPLLLEARRQRAEGLEAFFRDPD